MSTSHKCTYFCKYVNTVKLAYIESTWGSKNRLEHPDNSCIRSEGIYLSRGWSQLLWKANGQKLTAGTAPGRLY